MHWDGWMGHMGWMWLWWILIIVALIFLIKWLVDQSRTSPHDSPERELKSRYARGEINREEYQRRLDDIRR